MATVARDRTHPGAHSMDSGEMRLARRAAIDALSSKVAAISHAHRRRYVLRAGDGMERKGEGRRWRGPLYGRPMWFAAGRQFPISALGLLPPAVTAALSAASQLRSSLSRYCRGKEPASRTMALARETAVQLADCASMRRSIATQCGTSRGLSPLNVARRPSV